ncbi:hypothetical protein NUW54_g9147 [Trametes sanguinea]|uniref:Uncharacterized protein n=1 Tax=Trametes sanguinea TaxID=158606 RepID=A0ACC1PAJ2_9APHY|nr:hypothetical protein NUW54_g9147 [Trametes sanguinea]
MTAPVASSESPGPFAIGAGSAARTYLFWDLDAARRQYCTHAPQRSRPSSRENTEPSLRPPPSPQSSLAGSRAPISSPSMP